MGLVREPEGIDLIVGPSTLSAKDKKAISAVITLYKQTRKTPSKSGELKKQNPAKKRSTHVKTKI